VKPTVGRIVHFYGKNVAPVVGEGPFAAVVTLVRDDMRVDLGVFAPYASNVLIATDVPFKEAPTSGGDYWTWPPRE